jgi:DNA-binding XRE family transcriptional regulator
VRQPPTERLTTVTLTRRMLLATKQSTTRGGPWRQSSTALNDRLCEILPKDDDEDGYLLFARPDTNAPVVSPIVGAALAAQRECVDLTQQTVARRASISIGYLRAIEKGARQPTISVFLSICEAIGIDPRKLFNCALERMGYPVGFIPGRGGLSSD